MHVFAHAGDDVHVSQQFVQLDDHWYEFVAGELGPLTKAAQQCLDCVGTLYEGLQPQGRGFALERVHLAEYTLDLLLQLGWFDPWAAQLGVAAADGHIDIIQE